MKRINRKGFTLIELLAVIVIMAIIVVVTVPTIINTISDARVNSLWNLAKATANSYDTIAAQELLAPGKILGDIQVTTEWQCIHKLKGTVNGKETSLAEILDLSDKDVVLDESSTLILQNGEIIESMITSGRCSCIRLRTNGTAEVLLIAKPSGKFSVYNRKVYAFSSADKGTIKTHSGIPV